MATDVKNDTSLSTSLVSYWELEESSGTRVDSHASNDLTDNNTVGQVAGKQGNAADFIRANSETLSITNASQTGLDVTGDYSVAFWVKLSSLPTSDYEFINKAFGNGDTGYRMFCTSDDKLRSYYWGGGADTTDIASSATFVSGDVGNWVHIVIVVDVNGSNTVMYKNGSSITVTADGARATSIDASTNPFIIGSNHVSGGYLDAAMDEVGFWSKLLTATDVSNLYNSGAGIPYEASSGGGTPANNAIFFGGGI